MKTAITGCLLVTALAFTPLANAASETASGTLTVTGTVVSSITLTVETGTGGHTLSGAGTSAASADLGNLSKYGTPPQGFTTTPGASSWTLASTVGVKVLEANTVSDAYTLNGQLGTAPATGVVWSVNGFALNATGVTALTAAGVYGSTASYPWTIVIPDSMATATAVGNVITFSAIAG